jgi:RNA polymerase sigma-70 factor (ECF subfamily)
MVADQPVSGGEEIGSLVGQARAGDAAAFARLYRLHITQVYAFAARRLSDRDTAEDATQEIFTRALAGIARCRSDAAFPGWLFGIAHNVVNEHYRRARRGSSPISPGIDPIDPNEDTEASAIRGEGAAELRRARANCLNEKERALFDLLLTDLNDAQIATALGRRQGAVRTARWRLFARLRGCLSMLRQVKEVRHVPA